MQVDWENVHEYLYVNVNVLLYSTVWLHMDNHMVIVLGKEGGVGEGGEWGWEEGIVGKGIYIKKNFSAKWQLHKLVC